MIAGWVGSEGREGGRERKRGRGREGGREREIEGERERGEGERENMRVCVMESDIMCQSTEILFIVA